MQFFERLRRDPDYAPIGVPYTPVADKAPMLRSMLARGFTRPMFAKWDVAWDAEHSAMRMPVLSAQQQELGTIWRLPEGREPKYRYNEGFARNKALYGIGRLAGQL